MRFNKKIPLEDMQQFFEKSLIIMKSIGNVLPNVRLDTGSRYLGDATDITVEYKAKLPNGSTEELQNLSIREVLEYIRAKEPKIILRKTHRCYCPSLSMVDWGEDSYDEKVGYKFIENGTRVAIRPLSKTFRWFRKKPYYLNLEIVLPDNSDQSEKTIKEVNDAFEKIQK